MKTITNSVAVVGFFFVVAIFAVFPAAAFAQFDAEDLGGGYGSVKDGGWITDYYTSNESPWVTDYYTSNESPWVTDYYTSNETPWVTDYYTSNESPWVTDYYTSNGCDYSCGSYGGGYSSGGCFSCGGGFSGFGGFSMTPMSISSPRYPTPPSYPPTKTSSSNSSVTNTTVSNTSITNIDNSINDSFNNYNSNNVIVATPIPATPQYPIVYTNPAPYCTISQAQSYSYGSTNAVYLSWNSSNATSAYLSSVGSVQVNGSQTVWPTGSMTYILTVYGANGQSAQCQTYVTGYSAAPYVALTQIPYTGFDFGTFGNTLYWAVLASFAAAAAYLTIYFKGGVVAFAGQTFASSFSEKAYAPIVAAKAPILLEKEIAAEKIAPIVAMVRTAGTVDSMAIVDSKDGSMPKIVIDRS